jgi:hypothetical protein
MKRISLIILGGLALVLLVSAYAQTPTQRTTPSTQAQQTKIDAVLTPDMQKEYVQLTKSRAREADVRSWARRHKLEIVSLKGYDIVVIPEQPPHRGSPEEASNCDAKKCPKVTGAYGVANTLGALVGWQSTSCTAKSCTWRWDQYFKSWTRICGDWKCENSDYITAN